MRVPRPGWVRSQKYVSSLLPIPFPWNSGSTANQLRCQCLSWRSCSPNRDSHLSTRGRLVPVATNKRGSTRSNSFLDATHFPGSIIYMAPISLSPLLMQMPSRWSISRIDLITAMSRFRALRGDPHSATACGRLHIATPKSRAESATSGGERACIGSFDRSGTEFDIFRSPLGFNTLQSRLGNLSGI